MPPQEELSALDNDLSNLPLATAAIVLHHINEALIAEGVPYVTRLRVRRRLIYGQPHGADTTAGLDPFTGRPVVRP